MGGDIWSPRVSQALPNSPGPPRYDTREVMLKPGVNLSPYIKEIDDFYGHTITTRKHPQM